MIPVKLKIKGLYSYQEEQEIDFARLAASGLFGIFGSVGSGKSSILEAISYALYGETERLSKQDRRSYNMMNLRSNELYIDFEFLAGKTGEDRYRFVVQGRRNSKQFDQVNTLERRAFRIQRKEWIPLESADAEPILGLSYENFRRTIIIPQGMFQEFLGLTQTERTRMLKEIFNLERFELWDRTAILDRDNNDQLNALNARLEQIGEVSPDLLTEKRVQFEVQVGIAGDLEKELTSWQTQDQQYEQVRARFIRLQETEAEIRALEEKLPEIEQKQARLDRFLLCRHQFRDLFIQESELIKQQERDRNELSVKEHNLKTLTETVTLLEEEFEKLKERYENRIKISQEADDLEQLIKIRQMENQVELQTANYHERAKKLEELMASRTVLVEKHEQVKAREIELQQNLPNITQLAEVKDWFSEKESLSKRIRELEGDLLKFSQEKARIDEERREVFGGPLGEALDPPQRQLTNTALIPILEEKIAMGEAFLKTQKEKIKSLQSHAVLEHLTSSLTDGVPCPLCGSTSHPAPFDPSNADETLRKEEKMREKAEEKLVKLGRLQDQIEGFQRRLKEKEEAIHERQGMITLEKSRLQAHEERYDWPIYAGKDQAWIINAFNEANTRQENLRKVSQERQQADLAEQQIRRETEAMEGELRKFEQGIDSLRSKIQAETSILKILTKDDYPDLDTQTLQRKSRELLEEVQNLVNRFSMKEKELRHARENRVGLERELISGKDSLQKQETYLVEKQREIYNRLEKYEFPSRQKVEEILLLDLNEDIEKNQIEEFRNRLTGLKSQLNHLQRETEGMTYDQETHARIGAKVKELKQEKEEQDRLVGKMEAEIRQMENLLDQQKAFIRKKEVLELRAADLKTLKGLFARSGFVNYISTIYLEELTNRANERFRQLTRNTLQLEVREDNSFVVRDFLNGGQTRSIKTLSGGQTFQAAISLALALADNIHEQQKSPKNFFFLDEGFGTLDKESLQVVFETLKSLRKESRIVGIISHVEELQQEIGTHLRIVNQEEKGSIVTLEL
ncbi:MAG: SMC family ATPase [Bacteroidia bacterium]|nr:SMC family ATPase [Bacteroidia bacterium]